MHANSTDKSCEGLLLGGLTSEFEATCQRPGVPFSHKAYTKPAAPSKSGVKGYKNPVSPSWKIRTVAKHCQERVREVESSLSVVTAMRPHFQVICSSRRSTTVVIQCAA